MKKKKLWMPVIAALLLVAAVSSSCKKDTYMGITGVCPEVISTNPQRFASNVPYNSIVTVTFNEKMDPSTLPGSFSLTGTAPVAGVLTYDETNATMSFAPAAPLTPNTTFTGKVTTKVRDLMGNAMQTDYVWTFSTGNTSDTIAPVVINTDPAHNSTNVPLNKIVTVSFNEPMNSSTITGSSFILMQGANVIAGTVSYSGTTAFFASSSSLVSSTTYTARITTGAQDLAGNALANDSVWTFQTGTAVANPPAVNLNSADSFGILAGTGISNNAGFSEIHDMNVGISPGVRSSITGFPPAIVVNGAIYASDDIAPAGVAAMLIQAKTDLTNAYLAAEGASSPAPATVAGDLGGLTLTSGIYKSTSTLLVQSGNLTLDAQGNPNASWIFQIASDFTTVGGAGGNIILSGGAQAKNVFWQVGSSATIGDGTSFKGNVLALTSITMNSTATAEGRMLARNGAVVLTNTNIITKP